MWVIYLGRLLFLILYFAQVSQSNTKPELLPSKSEHHDTTYIIEINIRLTQAQLYNVCIIWPQ